MSLDPVHLNVTVSAGGFRVNELEELEKQDVDQNMSGSLYMCGSSGEDFYEVPPILFLISLFI